MPYKTHAILEVDSAKRSRGETGQYFFQLEFGSGIHFNSERQYFMRPENIRIPITFYDINATNNVFRIEEDNGVSQVIIVATIPEGNYQIGELLLELKTQLDAASVQANTYTLLAETTTGKINVSFTGGSTQITVQTITSGSTLNQIIGFADATYSTADSVILVSPNHMNLATTRYLNIDTDISSNNYYVKDGQRNIGAKVPITALRSSIEFYSNHNGPYIRVDSLHTIHSVNVEVRDSLGNIVDFNGVNWSMDLAFYEWRS